MRARDAAVADEPRDHDSIAAEMRVSCRAMSRHLLAAGTPVPAWIIELVGQPEESGDGEIAELVRAHDYLARVVHPALPQTLVLLEQEKERSRFLTSLGPVKLVRQLMLASAFFLATFVATSLSPDVNLGSGDIFESSGMALLVNEAFLLSAAGIGASFAALFQVNRYIAKGTYDPKFDTSYWTRFILGLIAGMVLAELIPVEGSFTRPLLSLIGGFSASVVYRILTRIVETLESFVSGEAPPGGRTEQIAVADALVAAEDRVKLAEALIELRRRAASEAPAVERRLDEIVVGLIGGAGMIGAAGLDASLRSEVSD